jgi:NADH:ubiquinone oxidoreductase subunit K
MRFFHQPRAQDLSEWLDVATRDLVPSAQARIRAEIETHYTEAVQSGLANGSPESVAQSAALADLGSANAANRRFRREHLTIKNAREATKIVKSARGGWDVIAMIDLFLICNFPVILFGWYDFDLPAQRLNIFGSLVLYALIFSVSIIVYLLGKKETTIATRRRILLFKSLELLFLSVLFLLQGFTAPSIDNSPRHQFIKPYTPFLMAGMCAIGIYLSYRFFRLRKKLQEADESDIPPPEPRAAGPLWPRKR